MKLENKKKKIKKEKKIIYVFSRLEGKYYFNFFLYVIKGIGGANFISP